MKKNKLNRTQRNNRRSAFQAMRPRGKKRQPLAQDPFRDLFPVEEPVPITQIHARRNLDGDVAMNSTLATTVVPLRDEEGKLLKDDDGRFIPKRVPVCRHKCTTINRRHKVFAKFQNGKLTVAPRPRDARRAALA